MSWTAMDQRQLEELAASGVSAAVAGKRLGVSRNAVLGRAFRTGVRFSGKPPKRQRPERRERPVRIPKPRGRRKGQYIKPRALILQVLALHLAGVSQVKAAAAFGVSNQSVSHVWRKDPVLMAEASAIAERALIEARAAAQVRCAQQAALDEERLAATERANEAVFRSMKPKHVLILRAYVKQKNMAAVGEAFGLTRERVRQIVKGAEAMGFAPPVGNGPVHRGYASRKAAA